MRAALNGGADKTAVNEGRMSALITACGREDDWKVAEAIVADLLRRGDLCDLPHEDGWTPLHYASRYSSAAVVNLLLEAKCRVDHPSLSGRTPLILLLEAQG